jgi:hypothetical protein
MSEKAATIGEKDEMKVLLPTKKVVDFSFQTSRQPFASQEKFIDLLKSNLGEQARLPQYFPEVPDLFKAARQGIAVRGKDTKKALLGLPPAIFDSDSLKDRGLVSVVEKIILAYEQERRLQGLPVDRPYGKGWSKDFIKELDELRDPKLTPSELRERIKRHGSGNIDPQDLPLAGEKLG